MAWLDGKKHEPVQAGQRLVEANRWLPRDANPVIRAVSRGSFGKSRLGVDSRYLSLTLLDYLANKACWKRVNAFPVQVHQACLTSSPYEELELFLAF